MKGQRLLCSWHAQPAQHQWCACFVVDRVVFKSVLLLFDVLLLLLFCTLQATVLYVCEIVQRIRPVARSSFLQRPRCVDGGPQLRHGFERGCATPWRPAGFGGLPPSDGSHQRRKETARPSGAISGDSLCGTLWYRGERHVGSVRARYTDYPSMYRSGSRLSEQPQGLRARRAPVRDRSGGGQVPPIPRVRAAGCRPH